MSSRSKRGSGRRFSSGRSCRRHFRGMHCRPEGRLASRGPRGGIGRFNSRSRGWLESRFSRRLARGYPSRYTCGHRTWFEGGFASRLGSWHTRRRYVVAEKRVKSQSNRIPLVVLQWIALSIKRWRTSCVITINGQKGGHVSTKVIITTIRFDECGHLMINFRGASF